MKMILVDQAKEIVRKLDYPQALICLALEDAVGYILARPVYSPISMPPFNQSAMDGYALKFGDSLNYQVIEEVQAGAANNPKMQAGDAVRIFTGAAVPDDADAVIMQEKTSAKNGQLLIEEQPHLGQNIRPEGEQIQQGDLALDAGVELSPAAIGFLVGLGIQEVTVYQKPKVAVVVTGSELVKGGQVLDRGQIYESNGAMLRAVLLDTGFAEPKMLQVPDDFEATKAIFETELEANDFLIISGGISVGDYDFVGKALLELGVKEVFYKVRQKPGKPMFLGRKATCTVFALPGNPAAALSCYYQYVLTALKKSIGLEDYSLKKIYLPIEKAYLKKGDRAHFLKAKLTKEGVQFLGGQSSAMLFSFAAADAFIYIPHDKMETAAGELVEVHLIP